MERYADSETMDHVITLRKRVLELEKQAENYEAWVSHVYRTATNIKAIARQQEDPLPAILEAVDFLLMGRGTPWKR